MTSFSASNTLALTAAGESLGSALDEEGVACGIVSLTCSAAVGVSENIDKVI